MPNFSQTCSNFLFIKSKPQNVLPWCSFSLGHLSAEGSTCLPCALTCMCLSPFSSLTNPSTCEVEFVTPGKLCWMPAGEAVPRQAAPPAMATSKVFLLLICSLGSLTDGTSARGQRMQQCRGGPCCSAPLAPAGPSLPPDLGTIIFLVRPHLPAGPGRAFLRVQLLLAGQHEARFPVLSPL